ncbi:dTDP-4-dehydrorhamnose 3,5-epimerase [Herbaspirillum rubrisubalbicans]|uniref:dTDP-4-dehydrorhamnose 3,5-epimerase n=1 Tax=Herbaspirillum rubrisubalbicans TaxID=80842 RepID=UPI001558483E|nr:dTDP-4-dehydrorhamnose 3,5-epimerase [Herbaspirillum rubrisubalbicans]NQE51276.1 dTDP-4-dehydrorhamnose 3,5-epimerase [Herbaspirillum rubrisubalbicans]
MQIIPTSLAGVLLIEPKVFGDERGYFYESYNAHKFAELTGHHLDFVQDNHSRSMRGVLRGLHYQIQHPQGKLVRATVGEVLDVILDIRRSSSTFGKWQSIRLSAENKRQLWIPPGFAHGFVVQSEFAEFQYKTTDYWMPEHERCILWNDPAIGIDWELDGPPNLSAKDRLGKPLAEAEVYP